METSNGLCNEEFKAFLQDWELDNEVTRLDSEYRIQPTDQTIHLEVRDL